MSRTVDVTNWRNLSESDAYYAFDRGLLTGEQMEELGYDPSRSVRSDGPPHTQVHTGDANTAGLSQADLDKQQVDEADLEPLEENLTEPQLQGYEPPEPVPGPDVVVNEDEDYEDWTVMVLREECAARDLSVSGNKAELVARLKADDAGTQEEPEEV